MGKEVEQEEWKRSRASSSLGGLSRPLPPLLCLLGVTPIPGYRMWPRGWWHDTLRNQLPVLSWPSVVFVAALFPSLCPRLWKILKPSGHFQILKYYWRVLSKWNLSLSSDEKSFPSPPLSPHLWPSHQEWGKNGVRSVLSFFLSHFLIPHPPPGPSHCQRLEGRCKRMKWKVSLKGQWNLSLSHGCPVSFVMADVYMQAPAWAHSLVCGEVLQRSSHDSLHTVSEVGLVLVRYFFQLFLLPPTPPSLPMHSVRMDLL